MEMKDRRRKMEAGREDREAGASVAFLGREEDTGEGCDQDEEESEEQGRWGGRQEESSSSDEEGSKEDEGEEQQQQMRVAAGKMSGKKRAMQEIGKDASSKRARSVDKMSVPEQEEMALRLLQAR